MHPSLCGKGRRGGNCALWPLHSKPRLPGISYRGTGGARLHTAGARAEGEGADEARGPDPAAAQDPGLTRPFPLSSLPLSRQDVSSRAPPAGRRRDRPLRAEQRICPDFGRAVPRRGPRGDRSRALPDFWPLSSRGLVTSSLV